MKTMSQYISVDDLKEIETANGYLKRDVAKLPKQNIIHCIECIHWQKMGGCVGDKMACNIAYWFCEPNDFCSKGEHL